MQLDGKRVVVAGATGVLGAALSRSLYDSGCQVVLAGRDTRKLTDVAANVGDAPTVIFEGIDTDSCAQAMHTAAKKLDGLDAVVVTLGVAGFGHAADTDEAVVEHLLAVNTLAPIALVRAALPYLRESHGTAAVLSAILADHPTREMAAYSASKAALSTWLTVLRREVRPSKVTVFDIRPPHLDTGLAERALAGSPPSMPEPSDHTLTVEYVMRGLREDAHESGTT